MSGSQEPLVTVVAPCRNEAPFVRSLLKSVLESEHPRERLEVKIVDGMSSDGTRRVLEEAARSHGFIRVLDNPKLTAPAGLNIGIRAARGEYIVRMDAHSEFPRDYIPRCLRLLRETGAANAGGRGEHVPHDGAPWARAVAYVTEHRLGVGRGWRSGTAARFADTVAFGTFRRDALEEVGLFDERLTRGQDHELNARLRRRGYKIAFDPEIRTRYWNRRTLRGLLRQGFVSSVWNVYALALNPHTWQWRRFVPAAFVLYLALLAALAAGRPGWAPAAAVPLVLYALLVGRASLGGREAGGRARVAATFVSYHLAYGAGTFAGTLNLVTGRWKSQLGRPLEG